MSELANILLREHGYGGKRAPGARMPKRPKIAEPLETPQETPPADAATRAIAQESLTRAFTTFTQAAGSLEKSYTHLQAEVERLHLELRRTNAELEKTLEENARVRAYLSRVLESLPCGILVVNARAQTQIINPEARRLLGVSSDWSPDQENPLPAALRKLFDKLPANSFVSEQEWLAPETPSNRSIGILRANVSEVKDGPGDTIWIVRDITEQKRLASERESARRSHALAEVAAVLAHEIRNPLGSMELFAGLLFDATAQMPETRQWVNHLQAGLRALSSTVNNVLHFHSEPHAQMVPTNLDRLLDETMEFLLPLSRQRGQLIRIDNHIGKVSTRADANRLKQVFFNLSLNAFRAMAPGGVLSVKLQWAPQFPGGVVEIDFQDEGRGVSPEVLERIYEPGYTTTPGSPGLGLSVCKKVIEQHGGEIRVSSKPNFGTTFSLFLPVSGVAA
jgi:signal transduction histidine kinase